MTTRQSAIGSADMTRSTAFGPPVDAPITTVSGPSISVVAGGVEVVDTLEIVAFWSLSAASRSRRSRVAASRSASATDRTASTSRSDSRGDPGRHLAAGLREEVDRAAFERLKRHLGALGSVRREHQHGRRRLVHQPFHGFEPAHPRHLDVHRHNIRTRLGDHRQRLGAVARLADDRDPASVKRSEINLA